MVILQNAALTKVALFKALPAADVSTTAQCNEEESFDDTDEESHDTPGPLNTPYGTMPAANLCFDMYRDRH